MNSASCGTEGMPQTAGAYLLGHGTPTAIILGRSRRPTTSFIRTAMGIRGEPGTPSDPAHGCVWRSVVELLDQPGAENDFISVQDTPREQFHSHPWSIGGGGAAELKQTLDENGEVVLSSLASSIGIVCFTLEDDMFFLPWHAARRKGFPNSNIRMMVVGEAVRHWGIRPCDATVFPYDRDFKPLEEHLDHPCIRYLWHGKTCLSNNKMFGRRTKVESGLKWYEFGRLTYHKLQTPLSITFANVVTHNHFVLDRGGKIFNSHAPLIKLGSKDSVSEYWHLLELLNSSTACFWLKQVCHNKGSTVDEHGARKRTVPFEDFYEFTSTALGQFPIPSERTDKYARVLDNLGARQIEFVNRFFNGAPVDRHTASALKEAYEAERCQMMSLQEELDWQVYQLYGLTDNELIYSSEAPTIRLGQRAFEIVMARKMAAGELETTWFERHGSMPITEIPAEWPDDYRRLVERRIELIETDRNIGLIEQPEYKRRWNTEPWESQLERTLRNWLLDRLESSFDFDGRMNDAGHPQRSSTLR